MLRGAQAPGRQAEVAAVRETSVVLAALIGMIFLTERLGTRRVAVAAGIVPIST